MIIIPEIETVVILVPRTGSGSLKRAVADRYEQSFLLYRHMEADGVPQGYDRWRRVGVLRHPLDRLWSLYQFCRKTDGGSYAKYPELWERLSRSVNCSFDSWLRENEVVFTQPYDSAGRGRFWPQYSVLHSLPENRKSQFLYLRPDLGTEMFAFEHLHRLAQDLDVQLDHYLNATSEPCPAMTDLLPVAREHVETHFAWDLGEWDRLYHGGRVA
jgi:hypothetical protein